ncbi:hypothetical protein BMETH_970_0 [methanotrophic bacterial endosymbiont of Bathymodiolus sp.]|nr:hypothetical protein BMETH_970_0 [methanotrophic bacterial endosymbiont of Bathymodiolus sp.]
MPIFAIVNGYAMLCPSYIFLNLIAVTLCVGMYAGRLCVPRYKAQGELTRYLSRVKCVTLLSIHIPVRN